ncbi:MAG: DUF4340 domain-containing protein [Treponema sp.]|nr:DUF4340 domain-containing protein [Treponema sp.]
MVYKKKIMVLSGIIASLVVIYILTFIFDPQRLGARSDMYSWLEPEMKERITGISISGMTDGESIRLEQNGGVWFVLREGKRYPARQARIDDFIDALTRRASYPIRSSSVSSHERLSLTEDTATRIMVTGGIGMPLLNLLMGQRDMTGQNIYLRKQGNNEVRSGDDLFSTYVFSEVSSWFNLRLFPENETGRLDVSDVQRLIVYHPVTEDDEEAQPPMMFTRNNREWDFSFDLENPDFARVNTYIRDILTTSGSDFIDDVAVNDSLFDYSRIILEIGDGSSRTLHIGPPDEDNWRYATVTGSGLVYSLPAWSADRLFARAGDFELN